MYWTDYTTDWYEVAYDEAVEEILLLAGAGYAHIGMPRRLSDERPKNDTVINTDIYVISEQLQKLYFGMLLGWLGMDIIDWFRNDR